jgi:hypothetical protein
MAGSYRHVTTDDGNLVSPDRIGIAAENLGDAYETIEEMYGMIWELASMAGDSPEGLARARVLVERARQNYKGGLAYARLANRGA